MTFRDFLNEANNDNIDYNSLFDSNSDYTINVEKTTRTDIILSVSFKQKEPIFVGKDVGGGKRCIII